MKRSHGTLLAGAVILTAAVIMVSREAAGPAAGVNTPVVSVSDQSPRPVESVLKKTKQRPSPAPRSGLVDLPPPVQSPFLAGAAGSEEWIVGRIAELDRLAWFNDPDSLHKILSELRNPLPEIRAGALAATLAFSSRESIPYLEMIARETRDPQEQKAIADAIEHLKLPTMVEELERLEKEPLPSEADEP